LLTRDFFKKKPSNDLEKNEKIVEPGCGGKTQDFEVNKLCISGWMEGGGKSGIYTPSL